MINKIILFILIISFINIFLFFVVPDSSIFTLNIKNLLAEPWRIFTFQFFHVSLIHLIENVIGFVFVAFFAMEFYIDFKDFLIVYFLSVFIVITPMIFLFPDISVAGNSTGIYGILALSLIKGRKLISEKITIPLTLVFIFSLSAINFISCGICYEKFFKSEFLHFVGFISGMIISFMPPKASSIP